MSALSFGDYALARGRHPAAVRAHTRHQQLWAAVFDGLRAEGMLREDVDVALCRVFVLGCINSVQRFDPKKRWKRWPTS